MFILRLISWRSVLLLAVPEHLGVLIVRGLGVAEVRAEHIRPNIELTQLLLMEHVVATFVACL